MGLVDEDGFPALTLPRLLDRAAVDRADFDAHFRGLADCFLQVFTEFSQLFLEEALKAAASRDRWREQVKAVADAALQFLEEDHARAHFMIVAAFDAGESVQLIREQFIGAMVSLVDAGRQELSDPNSVTPATADAIANSIFSRIRAEIEAGNSDRLGELAAGLTFSALQPYIGNDEALAASRSLCVGPGARDDFPLSGT